MVNSLLESNGPVTTVKRIHFYYSIKMFTPRAPYGVRCTLMQVILYRCTFIFSFYLSCCRLIDEVNDVEQEVEGLNENYISTAVIIDVSK